MKKKAVVLVNLGSPNSLSLRDIRAYLSEFLNDGRVIELPTCVRRLLVNGIIVPFRAGKSQLAYKKIWTNAGSPLIIHTRNLTEKLQSMLPAEYEVFAAMRYGKPSLKQILELVSKNKFDDIVVIPLFPQYASATTGSIVEFCMNFFSRQTIFPNIRFVSNFYSNELFIDAFAEKIAVCEPENFDFIIFSYHGLPEKAVMKTHDNKPCDHFDCTRKINETNRFCYRATCYETTRLIATKLNLPTEKYATTFQSRFADKWLSPFTDELIAEKARTGSKRVLVACPSFVADCLETIGEIGIEYAELFEKNGGQLLRLAESLNDSTTWTKALMTMVRDELRVVSSEC